MLESVGFPQGTHDKADIIAMQRRTVMPERQTFARHRKSLGTHPAAAEPKHNFGLGGPEGEKAGAVEFRNLRITHP